MDDHPAFREGMALFLANSSDMQLVAEAADGPEAVEQFRKHRPDVTLMDLQLGMTSGIDAITNIRTEFPEARIIVLTTYPNDLRVIQAFEAGARGYVLKGLVRKELLGAIRAVHAGQTRMPPEVADRIRDAGMEKS